MNQKKYHDIVRLGHRSTIDVLNKGDKIVIQEKIDGANASFRKDGDTIRTYSRNHELTQEDGLGGFRQWVQENIDVNELLDDVIYFGEWTNTHKVKYIEQHTKSFFLYDLFVVEDEDGNGHYESFDAVRHEAKHLGLKLVPVFYEGEYIDFEHLKGFIGRTDIGGTVQDERMGEGIVVKNVDYKDRFGNQKFVKLVHEKFAEIQKQKLPKDPMVELTQEQVFVDQTVTEARVDKLLHKLVDEGVLNEHFGIEDMGVILKNIAPRVREDILKEERDLLPQTYDEKSLSKALGRTVAKTVKKIIGQVQ